MYVQKAYYRKIWREYCSKLSFRYFNCKKGEIDIIAKEKNEFVFIEVKTRTNKNYGSPIDAVTYYKQKHLISAIQYYLYIKKLENVFVRIDIIEIYINNNKYFVKFP